MIYDLCGNAVEQIVNTNLTAGDYRFTFNGSHLKSGIYLCRLSSAGQTSIQKMILLK